MVQIIVGEKGLGKTAYMVKEITQASHNKDNNIVVIEQGQRLDKYFPFTVRLVNIDEFPVKDYNQLLAFISGIIAKDYDISHVYLDSIYKLASSDDTDDLAEFTEGLAKLSRTWDVKFLMSVSDDPQRMPDQVMQYFKDIR